MKYPALFISDLHLDPRSPQVTQTFRRFLNEVAVFAENLYILGDFFESYVGDDDDDHFIRDIKYTLKAFTNIGTSVFLMHGNRDFLIGERFAQDAGVQLIDDPTSIAFNNRQYLLMHGDSLCTQDISHQRFRRVTRHDLSKKLFLKLPLSFRKRIASQLRKESKNATQQKPMAIMDVAAHSVTEIMSQFETDVLIHGHTHQCAMHDITVDDKSVKRFVLDAWHHHGQYLKLHHDGTLENVIYAVF